MKNSKGNIRTNKFINEDLIEKCKLGQSAAQYKIYKLYSIAMYNTCYRMLGSRELAEDILQDSFTDIFVNIQSFRYESSFGSWIKRIVINKCINELKRKKPELVFTDDLSYFDQGDDRGEATNGKLNIEEIKMAIEDLPKGAKMIFSLYLLEGYDHQEISQILNISESNSKTQYLRAKRRIKASLEEMQLQKSTPALAERIYKKFSVDATLSLNHQLNLQLC